MFTVTVTIYCENHKKHVCKMLFFIKLGVYNRQWALNFRFKDKVNLPHYAQGVQECVKCILKHELEKKLKK